MAPSSGVHHRWDKVCWLRKQNRICLLVVNQLLGFNYWPSSKIAHWRLLYPPLHWTFPFRVCHSQSPASHWPCPSASSYTNWLCVLFHFIHESPLWSSSWPPARQFQPLHPSTLPPLPLHLQHVLSLWSAHLSSYTSPSLSKRQPTF